MAATLRPLRLAAPLHRSSKLFLPHTATPFYRPQRSFLSAPNPFDTFQPPTQTLHASRTLPYPSAAIYDIIADVSSYSSFLPYCHSSTVTKWSTPDPKTGKRWPSEAELEVGWGSITERFTSRIYCVPGEAVEATAGQTKSKLESASRRDSAESVGSVVAPIAQRADSGSSGHSDSSSSSILTHLLTCWTVRPFPSKSSSASISNNATPTRPKEHTEVSLSIEFRFANPLYSTMSAAVAPRVATVLIEAFEGRVRTIMSEQGIAGEEGKSSLETA